MTHLRIRTPEGVEFSLPLAGPVIRAAAYLIDVGVALAASILLGLLLSLVSLVSNDVATGLVQVGFFLVPILQGILLEATWNGQTLGKRALRIRVVDAEGLHLRPAQVVVRNLLRAVDFLPAFYLVGGVATLLSRSSQRLGDVAARTVVVRVPSPSTPNLAPILGAPYNSLRAHPHLVARLRQSIDAQEAALALSALARREGLAPDHRVRVFSEIARDIRSRISLPTELDEALADEALVRNVVDVLYRPAALGPVAGTQDNPSRESGRGTGPRG